MRCPACHYEELLASGASEDQAYNESIHAFTGLPKSPEDRHDYCMGTLGHADPEEEEDLGDPIEAMYSVRAIDKHSFISLWVRVWGFCTCTDPTRSLRAIKDVLVRVDSDNDFDADSDEDHFMLTAVTSMGLIDHDDGDMYNSRITVRGKLILNFLISNDIEKIFLDEPRIQPAGKSQIDVKLIELES